MLPHILLHLLAQIPVEDAVLYVRMPGNSALVHFNLCLLPFLRRHIGDKGGQPFLHIPHQLDGPPPLASSGNKLINTFAANHFTFGSLGPTTQTPRAGLTQLSTARWFR